MLICDSLNSIETGLPDLEARECDGLLSNPPQHKNSKSTRMNDPSGLKFGMQPYPDILSTTQHIVTLKHSLGRGSLNLHPGQG